MAEELTANALVKAWLAMTATTAAAAAMLEEHAFAITSARGTVMQSCYCSHTRSLGRKTPQI